MKLSHRSAASARLLLAACLLFASSACDSGTARQAPDTWLDNEPVQGRDDHSLLWGDAHQPKAALSAITAF